MIYEDFGNDDELVTWSNGYKQLKAWKAQIKERVSYHCLVSHKNARLVLDRR